MGTRTMGTYWRVILYSSIVGVGLSIGILNLYYLIFATEYALRSFGDAARWGALLSLATSGFVVVGTIGLARKLSAGRGKGLFITLSVLSPIVGWLLVGVLNGLLVSWNFFFGFPLIAVVSSAMAGIVATLATFFMPETETAEQEVPPTNDPLDVFDPAIPTSNCRSDSPDSVA